MLTFWHVPRMVLSWSMYADVGVLLGCRGMLDRPGLAGSHSEGFSVDRVRRAVYCWQHTRVSVADPSNLMVASHGHDPRH
eukprot:2236600-Prymnesium_polylepis.1